MRHNLRRWIVVVALGALALGSTAFIARNVFELETEPLDTGVRRWVITHQHGGVRDALQAVSVIAAPNPMVVLSLAAALFLWWRRRALTASTVLLAPAAAYLTYQVGKHFYGRARPPGAASIENDYAFPSAHATAATAVCCTLAYVFWQERLVPGGVALAIALLVPLLVGASRLYLDVHWATDVLGGWSAGVLIATLSMALYRSTH
jgi:membrane-associated phospholipid phosphatase